MNSFYSLLLAQEFHITVLGNVLVLVGLGTFVFLADNSIFGIVSLFMLTWSFLLSV